MKWFKIILIIFMLLTVVGLFFFFINDALWGLVVGLSALGFIIITFVNKTRICIAHKVKKSIIMILLLSCIALLLYNIINVYERVSLLSKLLSVIVPIMGIIAMIKIYVKLRTSKE